MKPRPIFYEDGNDKCRGVWLQFVVINDHLWAIVEAENGQVGLASGLTCQFIDHQTDQAPVQWQYDRCQMLGYS